MSTIDAESRAILDEELARARAYVRRQLEAPLPAPTTEDIAALRAQVAKTNDVSRRIQEYRSQSVDHSDGRQAP